MAYENATATALQDREMVEETIADFELHLRLQAETSWSETWQQQGDFINGLFEQYAPEVSGKERLISQLMGATGLTYLVERYGADEHHPKLYGGSYEQRVLATYHHRGHSAGFMENAFMYASLINTLRPGTYGPEAFMRFPVIAADHDAIMGNGRGNDERQSALLSSEMYVRLGFLLTPDEPTREGTLATGWDPNLKRQAIDPSRPCLEYQVASGVSDLLPVFDRRGPYQAICCTVEDMTKKMHEQILTQVADSEGISLVGTGVESCLDIIDGSDVLRTKYGQILAGQAIFFRDFTPADPGLDELFPGRPANVKFMNKLHLAYAAEKIGAKESLLLAKEYELAG